MATFTLAAPDELAALEVFLMDHGANEWNWLPPEVRVFMLLYSAYLERVCDGNSFAVYASDSSSRSHISLTLPCVTPQGVRQTFDLVRAGRAEILCARVGRTDALDALNDASKSASSSSSSSSSDNDSQQCIGIGIYMHPTALPGAWKRYAIEGRPVVYVAEMCVHRAHTGKGLGSKILTEIANRAVARAGMLRHAEGGEEGVPMLLMNRNRDNPGSAGMMSKVGCVEVDCYEDLAKKQFTTVLKLDLEGWAAAAAV